MGGFFGRRFLLAFAGCTVGMVAVGSLGHSLWDGFWNPEVFALTYGWKDFLMASRPIYLFSTGFFFIASQFWVFDHREKDFNPFLITLSLMILLASFGVLCQALFSDLQSGGGTYLQALIMLLAAPVQGISHVMGPVLGPYMGHGLVYGVIPGSIPFLICFIVTYFLSSASFHKPVNFFARLVISIAVFAFLVIPILLTVGHKNTVFEKNVMIKRKFFEMLRRSSDLGRKLGSYYNYSSEKVDSEDPSVIESLKKKLADNGLKFVVTLDEWETMFEGGNEYIYTFHFRNEFERRRGAQILGKEHPRKKLENALKTYSELKRWNPYEYNIFIDWKYQQFENLKEKFFRIDDRAGTSRLIREKITELVDHGEFEKYRDSLKGQRVFPKVDHWDRALKGSLKDVLRSYHFYGRDEEAFDVLREASENEWLSARHFAEIGKICLATNRSDEGLSMMERIIRREKVKRLYGEDREALKDLMHAAGVDVGN